MRRNIALLAILMMAGGAMAFAGSGAAPTNVPSFQANAISDLVFPPAAPSDKFVVMPGNNSFSKMVTNNQVAYFLHPVQTKSNHLMYDPWTIGQVLGYIYELAEFGPAGPPGGWTIQYYGNQPPIRWKRGTEKVRRGTLVFTKKHVEKPVLSEEEKYWDGVLDNVWDDDLI